jgi:hypothetical protein
VRCHAGNVDGLMLSDNDLAGRVPTQIGVLTHLQELRLNSGSISGSLPTQLGMLTHLRALGVDSNRLVGTLPTQLAKLTKLTSIDLDDNALSGTLPAYISLLPALKHIELHANSLSGTLPFNSVAVPSRFGPIAASHVALIDLEENALSGSIPTEVGALDQLHELRLKSNKLSGMLPTHMAALHIHDLTIDWKQFNGGQKPPWVRRNRGRSGRLRHFATLGEPFDNHSTPLADDSDEVMARDGLAGAINEWKSKGSHGTTITPRKPDEL